MLEFIAWALSLLMAMAYGGWLAEEQAAKRGWFTHQDDKYTVTKDGRK